MQPFILWPTEYNHITQGWGERPSYYGKFGLPYHEGIDIRALVGTLLYAGVDGTVSEVGFRTRTHAYGYAFRIRFPLEDGLYELIYAHGKRNSAKFNKGETVQQGQVVMLADTTGNTRASHLHLSLKKCVTDKSRAAHTPTWARDELDYFFLDNGEAMINPEPWLIPFEESQKLIKGRLSTPVKGDAINT